MPVCDYTQGTLETSDGQFQEENLQLSAREKGQEKISIKEKFSKAVKKVIALNHRAEKESAGSKFLKVLEMAKI